ncbi:MAG: phenylalanine--tRNA ligase subunit beta [Clostridia bacterium]|nr:MAG: phenylalanine--tRNA ligase subunit beta [Clostridia bacterium]
MRVPLEWLQEYVAVEVPPEELAARLTDAGLEVDSVATVDPLPGVITCRLTAIEPHPDSLHLWICQVDTGGTREQVVSGAPNLRVGQVAVLARPGAVLPGGQEIRKARFRGVDSEGMLCSAPELGLPGRHEEGILELGPDTPPGQPVSQVLGLEEVVIGLEITPNRADCLGLANLAREVAAVTGAPLKLPGELEGGTTVFPATSQVHDQVGVTITEPELCYRYVAKIITGVRVAPSPAWMQRRLEAAGFRAVNNVVDITNYVMLETGQPLHAFDYARLSGPEIIVRRARDRESIRTLDGVERELAETMLVIADREKPVAVAGVMGGEATEITGDTTTVLLESACFAGPSVRQTARQLGLASEASLRFARGVDREGCLAAAERACRLLAEIAGGEVVPGAVDSYPCPWVPVSITLSPSRVQELLGAEIPPGEMVDILSRLQLQWEEGTDGDLRVHIPSYRADLTLEADLVEEVARLWGYNRIPAVFPPGVTGEAKLTREQRLEAGARQILATSGLYEVVTYSFISPQELIRLGLSPGIAVRLRNPLREEQGIMRPSLLPGLLQVARDNLFRQQHTVAIYEVGKVFHQAEPGPHESLMAAALVTGERPAGWNWAATPLGFFYLKGILEEWMRRWGIELEFCRAGHLPFLHPGRAVVLRAGGREVGFLGEVHPEVQRSCDLPRRATVFEVELRPLMTLARLVPAYQPLLRFPVVERDVAVIVPEDVPGQLVQETIAQAAGEVLRSIQLFDVYQGEQIGQGRRSLAFHLVYGGEDHTLNEEELASIHGRVVAALGQIEGVLRQEQAPEIAGDSRR